MQSWQMVACSKVITVYESQSRTTQPTKQYNPHRGIVNCATFNHTNKLIASCGQDSKIVLAKAADPDKIILDFNYSTGKQEPSSINCCAFSSHSNYIAAGSVNNTVKIWNTKNPKEPYLKVKAHSAPVTSLAWFSNEEVITSASTSGDIFLHSVKTGTIMESLNTGKEAVNKICIAEDKKIASCTSSGSILVWDINSINSNKPVFYFNDDKKASINSISISPFKPALMVSASIDSSMTFYDINEKKQIKKVATGQSLTSVAFHENGHTIAVGGMNGNVMIYELRKLNAPVSNFSGHQTPIKHVEFSILRDKDREKHRHGDSFKESKTKQQSREIEVKEIKSKVLTPNASNRNLSQAIQQQDRQEKNSRAIRNLAKREQYNPSTNKNSKTIQNFQPTTQSLKSHNHPQIHSHSHQNNHYNTSITYGTNETQPKMQKIGAYPNNLEYLQREVKDLRMEMHEQFEALQLEIIRQGQIQLKEIKKLLDERDEEKKEMKKQIEQLQRQNHDLKKRTF